jgi:hypothetical protein
MDHEPSTVSHSTLDDLRSAGADRGFALVLGDPDGGMSLALAAGTRLRVVNAQTDRSAAAALREKLLASTAWYGSRIHVQTVDSPARLPFAQYFANAVVVAGQVPGLSGKELYRVLRPCGGMLLFPGLQPAEADTLARATGAAETEHRTDGGVVRGELPGALDWDTKPGEFATDQRVKWPLRCLWFGGPATRQVQLAGEGAPGPAAANGRCDVDGLQFPVAEPVRYGKADLYRGVRLNDEFVYLQLGKAYSRGKSDAFVQLDARTGEQREFYGWHCPPTPVSLKTPQTWPVNAVATGDVDRLGRDLAPGSEGGKAGEAGTVCLEAAEKGLVVTLTSRDPAVTPLDAWELFFDLRAPDARPGTSQPRGAGRSPGRRREPLAGLPPSGQAPDTGGLPQCRPSAAVSPGHARRADRSLVPAASPPVRLGPP